MTTDNARAVLADPRAPAAERFDAQAELQQAAMPTASDLIPADRLKPLIDWVRDSYEEQEFNKSLAFPNVIPFPSRAVREKQPGMQSVYMDDVTAGVFGDYFEKPGSFGFDSMRAMVDQTPILSAIVLTRIRQVQRFCRLQEHGKGPGFEIRLRDLSANPNEDEKNSIKLLQDFFTHCGWETNPRQRARLRRDNFTSFMVKFVRDSLTLDSAPIETEYKRDKKLGMDGFYAVDGATIRLCTENGYRGEDEIRALQVVQGQLRTAYTFDDLIYQPRNPRSNVEVGGYGLSETELLIKVVTNLLNAMTYNGKFFDSNSIPKGLLHLSGSYDDKDLAAFRRQWNGMVRGINNAWTMPVMVSKDQESKATFEKFGVDVDEMMFGKWMTFLTSIACAIYSISPDEINFESFRTTAGGLNGNDTEEKLAHSSDKGLRPLLSYCEDTFSDFIVADFSDKYVFRFTGLDEEDEKQKFERQKLVLTVNEMRAQDGLEPITEDWGDAPLNPSLLSAWQAEHQQGQEDFGNPGADGQAAAGDDQQGQDNQQGGGAQDFGDDQQMDFGDGAPDDGSVPADPNTDPAELQKSFGLPVFVVDA
jgi:hypothetical protein